MDSNFTFNIPDCLFSDLQWIEKDLLPVDNKWFPNYRFEIHNSLKTDLLQYVVNHWNMIPKFNNKSCNPLKAPSVSSVRSKMTEQVIFFVSSVICILFRLSQSVILPGWCPTPPMKKWRMNKHLFCKHWSHSVMTISSLTFGTFKDPPVTSWTSSRKPIHQTSPSPSRNLTTSSAVD